MGPAAPDGPPAALPLFEPATGNVHLMQGGLHSLGQHSWAVGEHVEPAFVADDGFVHAAFITLALVVGLRKTKENLTRG